MTRATQSDAWRTIAQIHGETAQATIADLFADEPDRFQRLSWTYEGVLLDLSKNRIDATAMDGLVDLARTAGVETARDAMFTGQAINATEDRPALHVALRDRSGIAQSDVQPEVGAAATRLKAITNAVRDHTVTGATGRPFQDVVSIGIGGSYLGPLLAVQACGNAGGPRVHFAANVDGHDLAGVLDGLDPETTLFLVASKSFTTQETLTNAVTARAWLAAACGEAAVGAHFWALTAKPETARDFGIAEDRVFPMWDWVGGRFSLWSAVGLPAALAMGWPEFSEMLDGAHAMDRHFLDAPLDENMPVLLALAGIWNINFEGLTAHAVVPYDERLGTLPSFLQQLEMESNGKAVDKDGIPLAEHPAPAVFGLSGTNAQHTFHQWLHQGPRAAATDFIGVARPDHGLSGHHDKLIANMLAQAEALAMGTDGGGDAHRACAGNRPSTTILLERLDARRLGMLIALYEHKVFVQGVIWGLNSFDQFGVELGKQLAARLLPALEGEETGDGEHDSSTNGLMAAYRAWRDGGA